MDPDGSLTEQQTAILAWLDRNGAVSPGRMLAQTDLAPREAWAALQRLAELGLVVIRDDPDSPDGTLVLPTTMRSMRAQPPR